MVPLAGAAGDAAAVAAAAADQGGVPPSAVLLLLRADFTDSSLPVGSIVAALAVLAVTLGYVVLGGAGGADRSGVSEEERRHMDQERRRRRVVVEEAVRGLKEGRATATRLWEALYDEAEGAFVVAAPFALAADLPGAGAGWFPTLVEALGGEEAGALRAAGEALEEAEVGVQRALQAEGGAFCQKVLDARRKERLLRLEELADAVKRAERVAKAFRAERPPASLPKPFFVELAQAKGLLTAQERIRRSLVWDIGRQILDPQIAGWLFLGVVFKILMGAPAPLQVLALSDAARGMARGGDEGYLEFTTAIWNCFLFFCGEKVLQFSARVAMIRAEQSFTMKLQRRVYSRMLQQDYEFFDGRPTAELQNLVHQSTEQVCASLIFARVRLVQFFASIFWQVALIAWRFPRLALVVNASAPIAGLARYYSKGYIERAGARLKARSNLVGQRTWDVLANLPTVRAHCRERWAVDDYTRCMAYQARITAKLQMLDGVTQPLLHFCDMLCVFLGYYYGGGLIRAGSLTTAELVTVVRQFQIVTGELAMMLDTAASAMLATEHGRDVLDLLYSRPKIEPEWPAQPGGRGVGAGVGSGSAAMGHMNGHAAAPKRRFETMEIEFREVAFSYPGTIARAGKEDHRILKSLSFVARHGEFTALVGKTGCGKSTITLLLQRLYDVSHGGVLVNGVDVRQQDVRRLRRSCAVVTQEPVLFSASVHDNLLFALEDEDGASRFGTAEIEERMVEACARADAWEFVQRLPDGLRTNVGPRGSRLSGGQKQRLTIARAILKDAPCLILDEATSSLDVEAERAVQHALDGLLGAARGGVTRLVVAHRLSTVRLADKIVAISEGVVQEEGTHDELVARDGMYARFQRLSMGDPAEPSSGGSSPSMPQPPPSASGGGGGSDGQLSPPPPGAPRGTGDAGEGGNDARGGGAVQPPAATKAAAKVNGRHGHGVAARAWQEPEPSSALFAALHDVQLRFAAFRARALHEEDGKEADPGPSLRALGDEVELCQRRLQELLRAPAAVVAENSA